MSYDQENRDYMHLRGQTDDVLRHQLAISQADRDWTIINMLPTKLVLWLEHYEDRVPCFFAEIEPNQTLKFPPNALADHDRLLVYYKHTEGYSRTAGDGTLIPFLQPHTIRAMWKTIRLGAVTYSSEGGQSEVQASHWDLRGIWLRNKLPIPLDVYYKGRLAAQLGGYNGMSYLGGGGSEVYFDNGREGLNFMDELIFRYSLPGEKAKYLFSVTIDDEQCLAMNIGVISAGMIGPDPDNAIYRVHKPVFTGITFYRPIGRGNSVATNPNAPF